MDDSYYIGDFSNNQSMVKEFSIIKMEILNILEILYVIKLKEMENLFMKMEYIILGNGLTMLKMVKVSYIIKMEILNMKEILRMIK